MFKDSYNSFILFWSDKASFRELFVFETNAFSSSNFSLVNNWDNISEFTIFVKFSKLFCKYLRSVFFSDFNFLRLISRFSKCNTMFDKLAFGLARVILIFSSSASRFAFAVEIVLVSESIFSVSLTLLFNSIIFSFFNIWESFSAITK